ncbi:4a-hydroxytetrahydrobiopterin dehydratase [Amycolatopsis saalfeldensis]|uniref:Putative pterin-4-alpha-carbinolamine dehydratase n=1 Tax=Amycolatopsis saalfeldensis TaxID=394193 RepID=A0A1H8R4Y6_9PSEU|nr:4a-hydroxytetrahydrobiopterin dehydratase [Amycolatopsis saalfeldensis]SEO61515.1 4a-hydroxytetrahydrobiopterin dehydratase [Amycolatopsis saalfeldensis]
MAKIMNDSQADEALRSFTDWHRSDVTIERTASLATFPQAIEVVNRVAALAEAADHHPDIDIRWRTLTFRLSTHSEGGLTAKDFALARQIDEVLTAL